MHFVIFYSAYTKFVRLCILHRWESHIYWMFANEKLLTIYCNAFHLCGACLLIYSLPLVNTGDMKVISKSRGKRPKNKCFVKIANMIWPELDLVIVLVALQLATSSYRYIRTTMVSPNGYLSFGKYKAAAELKGLCQFSGGISFLPRYLRFGHTHISSGIFWQCEKLLMMISHFLPYCLDSSECVRVCFQWNYHVFLCRAMLPMPTKWNKIGRNSCAIVWIWMKNYVRSSIVHLTKCDGNESAWRLNTFNDWSLFTEICAIGR